MRYTFAVYSIGPEGLLNLIGLTSTVHSFSCYTSYDFLAPKRAIQEDLGINKHDLVQDNLFQRENTMGIETKLIFSCLRRSRALFQIHYCFACQ